jgi:DNA mismatch endonuclease (patch repair protein)
MSRIRRRDTKPELLLRRAVWSKGLRGYRLDVRTLPGRPDLAWTRRRVAVFVDGAFWHGHRSAFTPGKSGLYWDEKIQRNVRRDREADVALVAMGWTVLRLWDFEIRNDLEQCVTRVEAAFVGGSPQAGAEDTSANPSLSDVRGGRGSEDHHHPRLR